MLHFYVSNISSENSGCDLIFLFSRNWCRDLNSMSRPHSLCLYCISVSRPRFDVATSFLLSSSLLLGHIFSFMLRHPSVVLNFQAGRDSKLLVCLFSCRDVDIERDHVFSLITAILVTTSKVCHDHPFFLSSRNLISQSQQFPSIFLFLVAT